MYGPRHLCNNVKESCYKSLNSTFFPKITHGFRALKNFSVSRKYSLMESYAGNFFAMKVSVIIKTADDINLLGVHLRMAFCIRTPGDDKAKSFLELMFFVSQCGLI